MHCLLQVTQISLMKRTYPPYTAWQALTVQRCVCCYAPWHRKDDPATTKKLYWGRLKTTVMAEAKSCSNFCMFRCDYCTTTCTEYNGVISGVARNLNWGEHRLPSLPFPSPFRALYFPLLLRPLLPFLSPSFHSLPSLKSRTPKIS